MGTDQRRPRGAARSIIDLGHLLVGGVALVFASVMIVAGMAPNAQLEGVFLPLGLLLALAATLFTCAAVMVLRRAQDGRRALTLLLSCVELVVGAAMAVGCVVAVQGYAAFEPWRSPLLLPSVLLVALGSTGVGLELSRRAPLHEVH